MNSVSNVSQLPASALDEVADETADKTSTVISAIFTDQHSARAAVRELREIGIPAEDISLISRDQDLPDGEAEIERQQQPVVTDFEVPPDEPLGGSERLGLSRHDHSVPPDEVPTDPGVETYTDFPEEAGDLNPEFPPVDRRSEALLEPTENATGPAGGAAIGVGLGSLVGLLAGMAGLTIPGIGPFIAAGPLAAAVSGLVTGGATGGIIGILSTIGVPEEHAGEYAAHIMQGHTLVSVRAGELTLDPVERVLVANGGESVGWLET